MKAAKTAFFSTLMFFLSINVVIAQGKSAIELSKLIEVFMMPGSTGQEWSMGASSSTPQIKWISSGIESSQKNGSYRRGNARVLLNGKEMQHLRERLEPVTWNLYMASDSLAKFGPEKIDIEPSCDTTQCSFDFRAAVKNKGFTLKALCKAGPGPFRQTAYEVTKAGKKTFLVVNEHLGSGGSSTSLTLLFNQPHNPQDLCSEARSVE